MKVFVAFENDFPYSVIDQHDTDIFFTTNDEIMIVDELLV